MTGLLILETLLLIVIVIGMICLTTLYYSLYKGFIALKGVAEKTLPAQNEVIRSITEEMDAFLNIIQVVEDKALDCYDFSEKVMADANANKEFAMTTMRTIRSLQKKIDTLKLPKPTGFRFEEPEDDPENPRS